jgi:predicted Zn-dependent protease
MKPLYSLIIVAIMLLASLSLVIIENPQQQASLSSVMELVGDAQKTATRPLMLSTKVTAEEEQELGRRLASNMHFGGRNSTKEFREREAYVKRLGRSLLGGIKRKEIKYEFHLIDNETVNAFALPGGQIFVFSGLLDFVESEAELASIIGHEITHVDARHCIELFQAELAAKKIGGPLLDNFLTRIATRYATMVITGGYRKYQEFEADRGGLHLAILAGYDPEAPERVMKRLGEKFEKTRPAKKAKDPFSEFGKSVAVAAGSYFHSHPPAEQRVSKLVGWRLEMRDAGRKYYLGRENLRRLRTRSQIMLAEEVVN